MLAPSQYHSTVKLSSTTLDNFTQKNLKTSHKTINGIDEYNLLQNIFCHPALWNLIVNYHHNTAWYGYHRLAR